MRPGTDTPSDQFRMSRAACTQTAVPPDFLALAAKHSWRNVLAHHDSPRSSGGWWGPVSTYHLLYNESGGGCK